MRLPPPRRRRSSVLLPVLATGLLFLAACGGSGYKFVGHQDSKAFFKVPTNWAAFHKEQLLKEAGQSDSVQASAAIKWLVGFDSAPDPSLDHVLSGITSYPTVLSQVRELSPQEQDRLSLQGMRNLAYPIDELLQNQQAELLSYQNVVLPGGIRGTRMVANVIARGVYALAPGNTIVRVQQIALVDPSTQTLYLFLVRCQADCYAANESLIDQIADSYTVKEQ